jgi:hypothetical protein
LKKPTEPNAFARQIFASRYEQTVDVETAIIGDGGKVLRCQRRHVSTTSHKDDRKGGSGDDATSRLIGQAAGGS